MTRILLAVALLCASVPAFASDDLHYCPSPVLIREKGKPPRIAWVMPWGPCKHADAARAMEWRI